MVGDLHESAYIDLGDGGNLEKHGAVCVGCDRANVNDRAYLHKATFDGNLMA
jgi:hypothetical protein